MTDLTPEEQEKAKELAQITDAKSVVAPAARDLLEVLKWLMSDRYMEKLRDVNVGLDDKINPRAPYVDALTEILIGAHKQGLDVKTVIQAATLNFVGEGHVGSHGDERRKALKFIYEDYL